MIRKTMVILSLLAAGPLATAGEMSAEEQIELARKAAPDMISADATIIDDAGNVLHQGSNGWTCKANTMPDDRSPICYDAEWGDMFAAMGSGEPYEPDAMGISYMLQGDAGVSNSDPGHPDPHSAEDFIKEGAHLMIVVPHEMLSGLTDDPHAGGPYVMWKDTPWAHIMVPIEDRED